MSRPQSNKSRRRSENKLPLPAGASGARPLVAIVGRPNVGKSTLFNRLAGQNIAIVEDIPGVTRDRHYADAWALGREYVLIDTGGFDPHSDDPMKASITGQVKLALEECDLVICVLDATTDPTPADHEAVRLLRGAGKPVLYAANKADSGKAELNAFGHYELGLEHIFPVSALHSRGLGPLEESLSRLLPEPRPVEPIDLDIPRVAIVGRPNAGKSSLLNRLVGEDRQIVDDRPGTTVDSVDTLVERDGHRLVLIDTAGMRRQRETRKHKVEAMSVYQGIRAMERSDLVVLMIDAFEGVGEQDTKIAGLAVERGCGVILVLNKTDLLERSELEKIKDRTREVLSFVPWAPIVTTSALTGRGLSRLLERIDEVIAQYRARVSTAEINRFFEEVLDTHPPPSMNNRAVRLYYVTQVSVGPPTFVCSTNEPEGVHFSYQRYVINQIRKRFGFLGVPVRVFYRGKKKQQRQG